MDFLIKGNDPRAKELEKELLARGCKAADGPADLIVLAPAGADEEASGTVLEADLEKEQRDFSACASAFLRDFAQLYERLAPKGRVALLTKASSSVTASGLTGGFGARMGLAACNMMARLLFNELNPKGYTFRVFAGNDMAYAAEYILRDRSLDKGNDAHSDEKKLRMRTDRAQDLAW